MSAHRAVPDAGATSTTSLMRSARGMMSPLQPTTAHTSFADSARVCSLPLNTRTCIAAERFNPEPLELAPRLITR